MTVNILTLTPGRLLVRAVLGRIAATCGNGAPTTYCYNRLGLFLDDQPVAGSMRQLTGISKGSSRDFDLPDIDLLINEVAAGPHTLKFAVGDQEPGNTTFSDYTQLDHGPSPDGAPTQIIVLAVAD